MYIPLEPYLGRVRMGSLCIFLDPDTMAKEIASQLEKCASQTEKDGRIFTLVLSGGSTDPVLYGKLAEPKWRDRIPWKSVHIFFADERCVPPENEESNYGICCRVLLDHIAIPNSNIHRIRGEEDPILESTRYAKEIQDHMMLREGQANFFDWVFLGVGTDGHTASLFARDDSTKLIQPLRSGIPPSNVSEKGHVDAFGNKKIEPHYLPCYWPRKI